MSTSIGPVDVAITREQLAAYAAASGDDNPIHLDDAAAQSIGLPGVIAHGMWTMGAVLAQVPGAVTNVRARFSAPVVVPCEGATIVVTGALSTPDEDGVVTATLEAHTADGERVIAVEARCA